MGDPNPVPCNGNHDNQPCSLVLMPTTTGLALATSSPKQTLHAGLTFNAAWLQLGDVLTCSDTIVIDLGIAIPQKLVVELKIQVCVNLKRKAHTLDVLSDSIPCNGTMKLSIFIFIFMVHMIFEQTE